MKRKSIQVKINITKKEQAIIENFINLLIDEVDEDTFSDEFSLDSLLELVTDGEFNNGYYQISIAEEKEE